MSPQTLPYASYARVRRVASFEELLTTPFADGVNALCWERSLTGDFGGVMARLDLKGGINALKEADLADYCYDLHYAPIPQAQPFSFGLGNLWKIAVDYPGCPVPPCIHRAPESLPGSPPRLLLLA